jgi:hypothetical protein
MNIQFKQGHEPTVNFQCFGNLTRFGKLINSDGFLWERIYQTTYPTIAFRIRVTLVKSRVDSLTAWMVGNTANSSNMATVVMIL